MHSSLNEILSRKKLTVAIVTNYKRNSKFVFYILYTCQVRISVDSISSC